MRQDGEEREERGGISLWKEWGLGNLRKAVGLGSDRGIVGKRDVDPEEVATGRRKRKSHLKRKREF